MDRFLWSVGSGLLVFSIVSVSSEITWEVHKSIETKEDFDENVLCGTRNCTECPGLNERCTACCKKNLVCYNEFCQDCYVDEQQWKCSSHIRNQDVLMTATQIAMTAALILGIVAIFTLLWKICTSSNQSRLPRRRRRRRRDSSNSGRSVDTLQQIVTERLRDAPPPYTRAILPPPGDTPPPYVATVSQGNVNACFEPDYNAEPPSYETVATQRSNSNGDENKPEVDNNVNDTGKPNENPVADSTVHM